MTDAAPGEPPQAGARRLSPLTPLIRAPIVLLAVVGGSWQQLLTRDDPGFAGLVVAALLLAGAAYGVASWLRTRYWIDGEELRIDTGVLFRQSRRLRIDRVQGIDIVQPLLARLAGLAELRFDMASGGDREGTLAFLPHREALALQDLLLRRRDLLREGQDQATAAAGAAPPVRERELARLDPGLLIASQLLSTQTLVLGLGAAFLFALYLVTGTFAVAGGVVPAVAAIAVGAYRRLVGYYGFRLTESGAGLHVRRGLTALSSQTIAPRRVQGYVVVEPLLWRWAGWARLDVSVAGYRAGGDADRVEASPTLLPVGPRVQVQALLTHLLHGYDATTVPLTPPPPRARWRAPLTAWTLGLGQDGRLLVSRSGWWVRRLDVVPRQRVQSLRLTQGPVQRWLRLADVHVDSPPGPVAVRGRHQDAVAARAALDRAAQRAACDPPHPSQPLTRT